MLRKFIFLVILVFCAVIVLAQKVNNEVTDSVVDHIQKQLWSYPQEKIYLHCDKPAYISGETVWFRIYLVDASSHIPVLFSRYTYVELVNDKSEVVTRVKIRPDNSNLHYGYLKLPEELPGGNYNLKVYTKYLSNLGSDFFYSRDILVFQPEEENVGKSKAKVSDYDVSFFPEGGYLLAGTPCQVAFKSINNLGLSENVEGELVDEKGAVITQVKTYHGGMGVFVLTAEQGKKYYLNCHNGEGKAMCFKLPAVQEDVYSLNVKSANNGYLYISVLRPVNKRVDREKLLLVVHTGGIVQYASYIEDINIPVVLAKNDFPSGVTQVLLLDEKQNFLSERLVFIHNEDQAELKIKKNKEWFSAREKVKIKAGITSPNNLVNTSLSISVIDGNDLKPDTTSSILTTLLLTSELKGHIENPGYYFQKKDAKAANALDILMMTQGWRRYDIPQALRSDYMTPEVMPEESQVVSGRATNERVFKNTLLKEGKIVLFVPDIGYIDEIETEDDGRFVFKDFELPDNLKYFVQALNRKGGDVVELVLDKESFPSSGQFYYPESMDNNPKNFYLEAYKDNGEYIAKADQKYVLDNGMRMVHLQEVKVTTTKPRRSFYATGSTRTYDREYLEKNNVVERGIESLLSTIPGISIVNGRICLRGNRLLGKVTPAAIIVDDAFLDFEEIDIPEDDGSQWAVNQGEPGAVRKTEQWSVNQGFGDRLESRINISDIESIDIVNNSAVLGSRAIGGAIVITTKTGRSGFTSHAKKENINTIYPLGYQSPDEFYSPKYDTVEDKNSTVPDLRTTIYWKPDVSIVGEENTEIEFYTADTPSTYYMVVEGITSDGKIIHQVETIHVR